MFLHVLIYVLTLLIVVLVPSYIRVRRSAAYRQQADQVVMREPGSRLLGLPQRIAGVGCEDFPFALLSQEAYQHTDIKGIKAGTCLDAEVLLGEQGWSKWPEFGSPPLRTKIENHHLRVEVWGNREQQMVAVAFGGTVFKNLMDWKANLRWFLPDRNDEYTVVVRDFGKIFVEEYQRRKANQEFTDKICLFSTGHSLGGGLAQQFAYSLPQVNEVPRVKKVYAFDPSPVTGFYSVKKNLRKSNAKNLAIDRIYERGEILAIVRSLISFFVPPHAQHPAIRQIRYNLFKNHHNPITGHSIEELVCELQKQLSTSVSKAPAVFPAAF